MRGLTRLQGRVWKPSCVRSSSKKPRSCSVKLLPQVSHIRVEFGGERFGTNNEVKTVVTNLPLKFGL